MFTLPDPELDELIDAFELQRELQADVSVEQFLPPPDHPRYAEFAVELLRVDMEHAWNEGRRNQLSLYCERHADILNDPQWMEPLAFEEYRLRAQSTPGIDRNDYARQFGIDVAHWPDLSNDQSISIRSHASGNGHAPVDNKHDFPRAGDDRGGFRYLSEIGRGTFSRVFLARQGELADRLVVLKVSHQRWIESDLLARLQHTNIVPIYSVHRHGSQQVVCMPYLGCCTLADVMQSLFCTGDSPSRLPASGEALLSTVANRAAETQTKSRHSLVQADTIDVPAPLLTGPIGQQMRQWNYVEACLWLMSEVAAGLRHAHQLSVMHRDLKPANILITDDGRPMLLDFNLSDDLDRNQGDEAQRVGGTLPYMSPEHLQALATTGRPDEASDIFSFGVVLYELLTGKRPFPEHRGSFDEVVAAMIEDRRHPVVPVRQTNRAVPRAVQAIVNRCLDPEPSRRYRSVDELHEDLQRQLQHQPLMHAPDRSIAERLRKWTKRHPRLSSVTSASLLACILIGGILAVAVSRQQRLSVLEAESVRVGFDRDYVEARLALRVPEVYPAAIEQGIQAALQPLRAYGVDPLQQGGDDWQEPPHFTRLDPDQQQSVRAKLAELAQLIAWAHITTSRMPLGPSTASGEERLNRIADDWQRTANSLRSSLHRSSLHRSSLSHRKANPFDSSELRDETAALQLYLDGLDAYERGDYREAVRQLKLSLKAQPQDFAAWFGLGNAHAAQREFDSAIECYSSCIGLRPQAWVAYHHRGLCRFQLDEYQAAERDFRRAVQAAPEEPAPRINLAITLEQQGEFDHAERTLLPLLEREPEITRVHFLHAQLLGKLGKKAEAERARADGLRRTPTDELSWIARGMARLPSDPSAALRDLQQALQVNPNSYIALRNSAYVLSEHLNQIQAAVDCLSDILTRHPDDAEILASRGVLYARANQFNAARADAASAVAKSNDAQTLVHAACVYSLTSADRQEDGERAVELLRKGLQSDPSWLEVVRRDPDLQPLTSREDFQHLMTAVMRLMQSPLELRVMHQ
jgi:serine/threonine protein kinase/tetratricopeptide (TPR) repeat protein